MLPRGNPADITIPPPAPPSSPPPRPAGIGIRESFNQNATTPLLVEGIFDSISTGILIYVVLVELIGPLMTQSPRHAQQYPSA